MPANSLVAPCLILCAALAAWSCSAESWAATTYDAEQHVATANAQPAVRLCPKAPDDARRYSESYADTSLSQGVLGGSFEQSLLQKFQSHRKRGERSVAQTQKTATAAAGTRQRSDSSGSSSAAGAAAPEEGELGTDPWDRVPQCFPWSRGFSIARADFEYPDAFNGSRHSATRGELIPFRCDGVVCPNVPVLDCYMDESICGEDQWCQLEDQMRFGPWGMANGETPNLGSADCAFYKQNKYDFFFKQVCQGQEHWGPWVAVRGRCVPYRKEQQSCNAYLGGVEPLGGKRLIHYLVDDTFGRPPFRPMVCGAGLACTGDVEPLPHTCVKMRPPNVCFQGPWWDSSTWCKVGSSACNRFTSGLPRRELEHAAQALIIQLPIDIYQGPTNNRFWLDPEADVSRDLINNIIEALWPAAYRGATVFPLAIPDPRKAGPPGSREWNATAEVALPLYRQSSKVWSTIHTLIHNCEDPMSANQILASRAIAVFLRQHFMCSNCRGLWANTVLNHIGLPPDSSAREDHKSWWWRAHNMVSEHAASTRGGHPWVWLGYTDEDFVKFGSAYSPLLKCQNPWFLPREYIDGMWEITKDVLAAELEEQRLAGLIA